MATVTEILNRASQITGLQSTGTERTLALNALNDVYLDAIQQTGCYQNQATISVSSSADIYDISSDFSITDLMKIEDLTASSGSYFHRLEQKNVGWITGRRSGLSIAGLPRYYSMVGANKIMFWPNPASGDSLLLTYVQSPAKALHETTDDATNETTPTGIPKQFHYNVLMTGLVIQMLDKDQRLNDGGVWKQRYDEGIYNLHLYTQSIGGQTVIEDWINDEEFGLPNDYRGRY